MGGFAKVTLIGNLGADPEVRFTGGGTAVANLRVACTEKAKNKEGVYEDRTEWVQLVCFGKTAENVGQYKKKGDQIYAEGRLQTREWEKDGVKRYSTEVVAHSVLFIGSGPDRGKPDGAAPRSAAKPSSTAPVTDESGRLVDDEIPNF